MSRDATRKLIVFSGLSIAYFAAVCVRASHKLLWSDELLTFYLSSLSSVHTIWTALATTAPDHNPPLIYVLTRAVMKLFGEGPIAIRLPSILGVWILELCVFLFVGKRTNAFTATCSILFIASTAAAIYAFEARPYGILLGLCGIALLSWQNCYGSSRFRRVIALASMTLALSAAVLTHYYAFLLFAPICAGELVRFVSQRRVDVPVWTALLLGMTPAPFLLPLIRTARTYSIPYWAVPEASSALRFYVSLLGLGVIGAILPLAGFLAVRSGRIRAVGQIAPPWEWAAACTLLITPALATIAAKVLHTTLTPRYALPAVAGCGILIGFILHTTKKMGAIQVVSSFVIIAACVVTWMAPAGIQLMERPGEPILFVPSEPSLPASALAGIGPLVVSNPQDFLLLSHYGSRSVRDRVVYLVDNEAAMRQIHMDNGDRQLWALSQWAPVRVEPYRKFVQTHPNFLFYGRHSMWEWQMAEFMEDEFQLAEIGPDTYEVLTGRPTP